MFDIAFKVLPTGNKIPRYAVLEMNETVAHRLNEVLKVYGSKRVCNGSSNETFDLPASVFWVKSNQTLSLHLRHQATKTFFNNVISTFYRQMVETSDNRIVTNPSGFKVEALTQKGKTRLSTVEIPWEEVDYVIQWLSSDEVEENATAGSES